MLYVVWKVRSTPYTYHSTYFSIPNPSPSSSFSPLRLPPFPSRRHARVRTAPYSPFYSQHLRTTAHFPSPKTSSTPTTRPARTTTEGHGPRRLTTLFPVKAELLCRRRRLSARGSCTLSTLVSWACLPPSKAYLKQEYQKKQNTSRHDLQIDPTTPGPRPRELDCYFGFRGRAAAPRRGYLYLLTCAK